jgi:hypothetical protein
VNGPRPQGRAWSRASQRPKGRRRASERVCRPRGRDLIASGSAAPGLEARERAGMQTEVWVRQPSGSRSQGRRPEAADLQAAKVATGRRQAQGRKTESPEQPDGGRRSRPGRNAGGEAARPSICAKSGPPGRKAHGAEPRSR